VRPVRVSKPDLLAKLEANRAGHRAIFEEALEGYRTKAIELFSAEVEKIRSGQKFRSFVSLTEPEDHTADYDAAIGMLQLSLDDAVELDEQSYRSFVLDEWDWKRQFLATNRSYSATAAAQADDDEG
jgi:hypothetical protein